MNEIKIPIIPYGNELISYLLPRHWIEYEKKEQTGAWTNIVLDLWYCVSRQQHLNNNIVSGCLSGHFLSLMLYGLPSSEENGSCIKIIILNNRIT